MKMSRTEDRYDAALSLCEPAVFFPFGEIRSFCTRYLSLEDPIFGRERQFLLEKTFEEFFLSF